MAEAPWKPIAHPTLEAHAQEIGRLCIYWSELELYVTLFLIDLLDIEDKTSKNVIAGLLDFRAKLQALPPMGFARRPSDTWYASLEKVVNHIDNDLRPERNRMIHDTWTGPTEGSSLRMQLSAKVVNAQSRTKVLKLAVTKQVKSEDIGRLYEQVIAATDAINDLWSGYKVFGETSVHPRVAQVLSRRENLRDSPAAPTFPPPTLLRSPNGRE
jgi:hypothetical protein